MPRPQPIITYYISHCHAKARPTAIVTLEEVIRRLGYNIPICPEGEPVLRMSASLDWECQLIHTPTSLRATINIYDKNASPIATKDELPYLDVTDNRR